MPNVVTLPEHCKQNGYFVQGMGKLFHPSVEDPQSWSVPRQTPKAVNYALSDPEDVHPTLADVAGLLLPQHLEGVSFKPVLVDPKRKWKPTVFSQYPRGQRLMGYSMRTERYRFPVWVGRQDHSVIDAIELYDHQMDPQDDTNTAKADGNAELVKRMMER